MLFWRSFVDAANVSNQLALTKGAGPPSGGWASSNPLKVLRTKTEVSRYRRNPASRRQHQILPEFSACCPALTDSGLASSHNRVNQKVVKILLFTGNVCQLLPHVVTHITEYKQTGQSLPVSPHNLWGSIAPTDSNLMIKIWGNWTVSFPPCWRSQTLIVVLQELKGARSSRGPWLDLRKDKPDRTGYLPVRKAALLGVHTDAAAMCWVSITPSFARRSIFGVLQRETRTVLSLSKQTRRLPQKRSYMLFNRKSAGHRFIRQGVLRNDQKAMASTSDVFWTVRETSTRFNIIYWVSAQCTTSTEMGIMGNPELRVQGAFLLGTPSVWLEDLTSWHQRVVGRTRGWNSHLASWGHLSWVSMDNSNVTQLMGWHHSQTDGPAMTDGCVTCWDEEDMELSVYSRACVSGHSAWWTKAGEWGKLWSLA